MSNRFARSLARVALTIVMLGTVLQAIGCDEQAAEPGANAPQPAQEQATEQPSEPEPEYTSWVVSIVDDDSYSKGEITYEIALNLKATHSGSEPAGTYEGEAIAKTSTSGTVQGQPLQADAIARSGPVTFKLAEGEGDLAALTEESVVYGGSGTITMQASGSGTLGAAGGSFSNTSSQKFTMTVVGDGVTMTIPIDGHTYTFTGTISGR